MFSYRPIRHFAENHSRPQLLYLTGRNIQRRFILKECPSCRRAATNMPESYFMSHTSLRFRTCYTTWKGANDTGYIKQNRMNHNLAAFGKVENKSSTSEYLFFMLCNVLYSSGKIYDFCSICWILIDWTLHAWLFEPKFGLVNSSEMI